MLYELNNKELVPREEETFTLTLYSNRLNGLSVRELVMKLMLKIKKVNYRYGGGEKLKGFQLIILS
ncbi:MAG: hypothetical protein ACI8ZM_000430 [Crocinitomix sp.]